MKAYNKKTFAFGVFSTALGVLNAVTAALRGADAGDIVLIACLLFFGIGAMLRGTSKRLAREDRLEELDERNRLVSLKTDSLTRKVMGWARVAAMAAGLLGYLFTENLVFGCLFLFAGLSITLEAVVSIAASIHYEKRL